MMANLIDIPDDFVESTIRREGEAGHRWIEDAPRLIRHLCERWNLELDGALMNGYLGMVIPVRRGDERFALKISWPEESAIHEAEALVLWNGEGAARLLDLCIEHGAMLLERLDSHRDLDGIPIEEAAIVSGRLLRRLAISVPETARFHKQEAVALSIASSLPARWEKENRPFDRRLLDRAVELATRRAQPSRSLLVNWDLHYQNVLAGEREPWLAVDPKVIVGDPEYGVAQLLWCRLDEMIAERGLEPYFKKLIDAAELNEEQTREWTLVRCIDYWLWSLSAGLTEDPKRCRILSEWLS